MLRIYGNYGLMVWLCLSIGVLLALICGSLQPLHPALVGLELCGSETCWHGLTIRAATAVDLSRVLAEQEYVMANDYIFSRDIVARPTQHSGCTLRAYRTANDRLNVLNLSACPQVYLGDVMALFGTPNAISSCEPLLTLYYNPDHTIVVRLNELGGISMYSEVVRISLYTTAYEADWRGFAPLWRYQQLNPEADYGQNCG